MLEPNLFLGFLLADNPPFNSVFPITHHCFSSHEARLAGFYSTYQMSGKSLNSQIALSVVMYTTIIVRVITSSLYGNLATIRNITKLYAAIIYTVRINLFICASYKNNLNEIRIANLMPYLLQTK